MGYFKRAQLAQAANVGLETIRFYEKEGLLPTPQRSESGYRLYTEADLARLKFIAAAKTLGFTLQETSELFSIGNHPRVVCPELQQRAQQKIDSIDAKIKSLVQVREMLVNLIDCCISNDDREDCFEQQFCTNLISLSEKTCTDGPQFQSNLSCCADNATCCPSRK